MVFIGAYFFLNNRSQAPVIDYDRQLATDFPDFPIHPQAEVLISSEQPSLLGKAYEADLIADDTILVVFDWYRSELVNSGWVIEESPILKENEAPEDLYIKATKDKKAAYLTLAQESDSRTHISIEISK